jgi:hypothetical protein
MPGAGAVVAGAVVLGGYGGTIALAARHAAEATADATGTAAGAASEPR